MATKTAPVIALERAKAPPPGRKIQWERIDQWNRNSFRGATPERVARVVRDVERGDFECWADLAEYMLRTDAHLRAVYETFLVGVARGSLLIKPNPDGDPALAEAAAAFARESHKRIERWDRTLIHLLHGKGIGLSVAEQHWSRRAGAWHVVGHTLVPPRDTGFSDDWGYRVRTYKLDEGERFAYHRRWIDLDDEPARWLVHQPGSPGLTPNVSGILHSVVWTWLQKIWTLKNAGVAVERLSSPFMYGVAEDNATDAAREALWEGLDNLHAGMTAVLEQGTEIKIIGEAGSASAGKSHKEWILYLDNQTTKGVLGSTLNTDVHPHGGNRALGESQADVTLMPRFESLAKSIGGALRETWLRPLLGFNTHLWGGRMPPLPVVELQIHAHEPTVDQLLVDNGACVVDELRRSRGQAEWGPDHGGNRVLQPLAKSRSTIEPGGPMATPPGPAGPDEVERLPQASRKPEQLSLLE